MITRVGSWEFIEEPQVLRYRMTPTGLIPGALILLALSLVCILWGLKIYRESVGWGYLWCGVAALCWGLCLYGLFHHLRSYHHPYALNKRTDVFSNGYKPICRLSEIVAVDVIRVEGLDGTGIDDIKRAHYKVDFALGDGESCTSYIGSNSRDAAMEYADVFREFLNLSLR